VDAAPVAGGDSEDVERAEWALAQFDFIEFTSL
jgi:hypothetical protein